MVNIADLRHRIILCTAKDLIISGTEIIIQRKTAFKAWAKIEAKKRSFFTQAGYATMEDANRVTHRITIRYRSDVDLTSSAWIYEERLKSPPRWFKVLGDADSSEDGIFCEIDAQLNERGPLTQPPTEEVASGKWSKPLPAGVKL